MKRLNAAVRVACLLAATFTPVFLSQAGSGDRHTNTSAPEADLPPRHPYCGSKRLPAVSGVPSVRVRFSMCGWEDGFDVLACRHSQHLGGRHCALDLA